MDRLPVDSGSIQFRALLLSPIEKTRPFAIESDGEGKLAQNREMTAERRGREEG